MEQNVITFIGKNEQLFTRCAVETLNPKITIIIPETHNAILIKDGQMLQTLSSGRYLLSSFINIKTEIESKIEVLFMSKTAKLRLLWGTASKFLMYDSQLEENYKVGMSGDFDVQIGDPRKCYLYLVGVDSDLTTTALQERLMSNVVSIIENVMVEFVNEQKILFNQITVYKNQISSKALAKLNHKLMSEYGIAVYSFNIANIIIDEDDLTRLNAVYKSSKNDVLSICTECGTPLKEDAKFCFNCGKKVGVEKNCMNCNAVVADGAKFCSVCGNEIKD